jgi:putative Holliday junction resolvase
MTTSPERPYIAALDVGARRIGVALARYDVALARPHSTLTHDETIWDQLRNLIDQEHVGQLVVGLPRGMSGQETDQTRAVRAFAEELQQRIGLPFEWQDEAGTSLQAEAELKLRTGHSSRKRYNKGDIDAQAAAIILQDYLDNHRNQEVTQ